ncbi:MAG: M48 family metalloprotease [Planctomycetota bacterium]
MALPRYFVSVAAALVFAAGCSTGPEWDRRVGDENAPKLLAAFGQLSNPELTAYVDSVGRRLTEQLPDSPFDYRFTLLDTETPNAFALPGGHIYVTRGLLPLLNSEDELAAVLAHEIIHSESRHAAHQHDRAILPSVLSAPGRMLGRVVPEAGTILASPWQVAGGAFLAAHSREHEHQADRLGQNLSAAAGYDPAAMPRFLTQLAAHQATLVSNPRSPTLFDTHPLTPRRIALTRQNAAALAGPPSTRSTATRTTDPAPPPPDPAFLDRLNGIVVGPDPARGLFRGPRFLHPDQRFAVTLPAGWRPLNTRQAFGGVAPDGGALVLFPTAAAPESSPSAAGPSAFDPTAAAQPLIDALNKQEIPLLINTVTTHHGRPRHHLRFAAGTLDDGQTLVLDLLWTVHGDRLYTQIGAAPRDRLPLLDAVAASFGPLPRDESDRITVRRLRTVRVSDEAVNTLRAFAGLPGIAASVEELAAYNATTPETSLAPDRPVKLVFTEPYRVAP